MSKEDECGDEKDITRKNKGEGRKKKLMKYARCNTRKDQKKKKHNHLLIQAREWMIKGVGEKAGGGGEREMKRNENEK